MVNFPPIPPEVKPVAHLLKVADEHESRNIVVAYWARMAACQLCLKLVPGQKSPQVIALVTAIMDWLESTKNANQDNDGITNQMTAQAVVEEYCLKIFEHADSLDKQAIFDKNTVKLFYSAGVLMDILDQFGKVEPEISEKRKYAKWKAAYIHNCLKHGEVPIPGPIQLGEDDDSQTARHKDEINPEELKNYTRFVDPSKPSPSEPTAGSSVPPLINIPSSDPENVHIPSRSPITPIVPTNPTPFNTPVPPLITSTGPAPSTPSPRNSNGFNPDPEAVQKAQKYCKYAASALNYDDVKTAVENLTKALCLLQTGKE